MTTGAGQDCLTAHALCICRASAGLTFSCHTYCMLPQYCSDCVCTLSCQIAGPGNSQLALSQAADFVELQRTQSSILHCRLLSSPSAPTDTFAVLAATPPCSSSQCLYCRQLCRRLEAIWQEQHHAAACFCPAGAVSGQTLLPTSSLTTNIASQQASVAGSFSFIRTLPSVLGCCPHPLQVLQVARRCPQSTHVSACPKTTSQTRRRGHCQPSRSCRRLLRPPTQPPTCRSWTC